MDIRKIINSMYRDLKAFSREHIKHWIEWRREHQIVAMWYHYRHIIDLQL